MGSLVSYKFLWGLTCDCSTDGPLPGVHGGPLVVPPDALHFFPHGELDEGEGDLPAEGGGVPPVEAPDALLSQGLLEDAEGGAVLLGLPALLHHLRGHSDDARHLNTTK